MTEITFHAHPVIYSLVLVFLFAALIVWCMAGFVALRHAPLDEDVPAPEASAGPSAEEAERPALPEGYVEPKRTYELRAAFVARRATSEEIKAAKNAQAIRELMQNVGRN